MSHAPHMGQLPVAPSWCCARGLSWHWDQLVLAGLRGTLWGFVGFLERCGALWDSVELHGALWDSLELSRAMWGSVGLHGIHQGSMGFSRSSWDFVGFSRALWDAMGLSRAVGGSTWLCDDLWGSLRISGAPQSLPGLRGAQQGSM